MKSLYKGYMLDSTEFGVDIFRDGAYVHTINDDVKRTERFWIVVGEDWVNSYLISPK